MTEWLKSGELLGRENFPLQFFLFSFLFPLHCPAEDQDWRAVQLIDLSATFVRTSARNWQEETTKNANNGLWDDQLLVKHLTNFSTHLRHGGCNLICPNHDTTQVQLAVKKNTDWKKARSTLLVWITATLHFPFGWFSKRRRKKMAIGWSWSEKGYNRPIKLQQQQQNNNSKIVLHLFWL